MLDIDTFLQQTLNGGVISAVYVLVAIGITLAFGLTGIANFAHGQFMLLGGFFAYQLLQHNLVGVIAAAGAIVGVAAVSFAAERGVFRFTLDNPTSGFVASLGLSIALESSIVKFWGLSDVSLHPWLRGVWTVHDVAIARQRVLVLVIAFAAVALLFLLLQRTGLGRAMRACAEDRQAAALMGVNVKGTISTTFAIGGAIAGLAGLLLGTLFPFSPFSGGTFVLKGFAIALIGGLGSVTGALAGSLLLGMGEAYCSAYWNPAYRDMIAFVIMIAVISLRPSGIFGRA